MRTLHEAIIEIVDNVGNITPAQIAWILNQSNLYVKHDNSEIQANQIYTRISQYPNLLYVRDGKVFKRFR